MSGEGKKERKGVSMHTSVLLGIVLSNTQLEIQSLLEIINKFVMMRSLKEEIIEDSEPLKSRYLSTEKEETFVRTLQERVSSINKNIEDINAEVLGELGLEKKLRVINQNYIKSVVKERIKSISGNHKSIQLANENLMLKLSFECRKVLDSLMEFLDYLNSLENYEGIKQVNSNYHKETIESININSFGYGKTSVLCIGRTIEKAINDLLRKLLEKDKISKEDFEEFIENDYNNKIGFLKSKFINEEEFTKLKAFSFDRNKGGHPDLGDINLERARSLISQGIWLIIDLQDKIKHLDEIKNSNKLQNLNSKE